MKQDSFGDKMKEFEMAEAGRKAMPGLPLMARLDGRAFHTFTRGMERPYDLEMSAAMLETTKFLVDKTHALIGYTQSDEITLVWNQPDIDSEYLFDGRFQKLTSVLAGMASAYFMKMMLLSERFHEKTTKLIPSFDCRVWQVPSMELVVDTISWRVADAIKNSISMAAQAHYSHKELNGKSGDKKKEMLLEKGIDWDRYPSFFKAGIFVKRVTKLVELSQYELSHIPEKHRPTGPVYRTSVDNWGSEPLFPKIKNKVDYLFHDEEPVFYAEKED